MKPKIKNCRYIFGVLLLGILIWVGLLAVSYTHLTLPTILRV